MKIFKEIGLIFLGALAMFTIITAINLNIRLANLEKAYNNLVRALSQPRQPNIQGESKNVQ